MTPAQTGVLIAASVLGGGFIAAALCLMGVVLVAGKMARA